MVKNISYQNATLTLLRNNNNNSLSNFSVNKKADKNHNPLLDILEKAGAENVDELREKFKKSQALVDKLSQSSEDAKKRKKAEAAQKVEELKKKIQQLKLFAALNPKAAAKQIKALAKELKAAVKQYSEASDGEGGAGVNANVNVSVTSVSVEGQVSAEGEGAQAQQAAQNAEADIAGGEGEVIGEEKGNGEGQVSGEQGKPGENDEQKTEQELIAEEIEKRKEARAQEARQRYDAQIQQAKLVAANGKEDEEFLKAVEEVKRALESLLEMAKRQLEQENDAFAASDVKDAEKALEEVEEIMSEGFGNATTTFSVLV